ncbi:MAG TPA: TetR/AcrR family transcriptional regulator [Acidimicrobiia bacterium]|nr:TetR/AcrR family transcriptional regulator [Acidimicrobiia bacterium]
MTRLGRPPATDSAITKRRILREARYCFGIYGYDATTNKMVAERAELTTTAIYHYFGSKRDLFLAVHRETSEEVFGRMRDAVRAADTFLNKVNAMLQVANDVFATDADMAAFVGTDRTEARRHAELAEILEDRSLPELVREVVEAGVGTGEIARSDAFAVRGLLVAVMLGMTQLSSEISLSAHRKYINAFKQLFAGDLVEHAPPPLVRTARE